MGIPNINKFGKDYLELRIRGMGKPGKGDRIQLLSASDARILAYTLLAEAEKLDRDGVPRQRSQ
jgi:hypothetical protein